MFRAYVVSAVLRAGNPADRRAGEPTRAEQAPGRRVDEELHRPDVIRLRRVLEMRQGEADGFRKFGPTVRHGRADQLAESRAVLGQRMQHRHGRRDEPNPRLKQHAGSHQASAMHDVDPIPAVTANIPR